MEETAAETVAEEVPQAADAAQAATEEVVAEPKSSFTIPPLCTPKESRETAFLKETENMQKKVNLRTDIDPDEDLDAFLADIKLFLDSEA